MVEIDAGGRVLSVATGVGEVDRMCGVEFYPGILLPGLVNAHCHLELSYLKGAIPEGCGFAGFARAMGEVRGRFDGESRRRAAAAADAAMWQAGIQAVGDIVNGDTTFGVKECSRIAYRSFAEVFGLKCDSTERMRPLLRHPHTSLTPHSVYSVQDAPFRTVCAGGDAPLSIHFQESPAEEELFQRRGPLWEWYERAGFTCDFLHYGMPAERIVECVPRDRSVILVHDCCVTPLDIDLIMNHFTAPVYWCLCPRSNHYISRLQPPVELLRSFGLNICIGTDSLASNHSLSLLDELKLFSDVPLAERLGWATRVGAAALGMAGELGEAAPGRRCGLAVLSGLDYTHMALTSDSRIDRIA